MSAVQNFYNVTMELITWLLEHPHDERDERIKKIEELMEKREAFMQNIKPPFSPEEQLLGKKLMDLNQQLDKLLLLEKTAIQKNIKDLHKTKESTNKYANPYQSLNTDGIFYDKRK